MESFLTQSVAILLTASYVWHDHTFLSIHLFVHACVTDCLFVYISGRLHVHEGLS